ncbi:unnamed protein product [Symbiodinium necroappetens]|uniref:Sulfatase N-terminal domain-containing protein n=1 Tax=Symbiodinium necroappetens TaxID=1628268 RepID=A0A812KDZ2_9DINO|nr:unnamed protein product [Symbiodinium necroappetens]
MADFFVKQGTNFVRSYANSPQCVPSRSSMCTGRRTDQIEARSNEKGLAASEDGTLDKTCIYTSMAPVRCLGEDAELFRDHFLGPTETRLRGEALWEGGHRSWVDE